MTFGDKLKRVRNERKMTQKTLAEILDVKESSISDWEHNRHKPSSLDTFKLMCETFDVPSTYFLCEKTTLNVIDDVDTYKFLNTYIELSKEDKKKVSDFIQELKK